MQKKILDYIECKNCFNNYELIAFHSETDAIIDGILKCNKCGRNFFIYNGIPRFVPINYLFLDPDFLFYINNYAQALESNNINIKELLAKNNKKYTKLSFNTSNYFGYEWDYFSEWGWIPDEKASNEQKQYDFRGGLISNTNGAFKIKCLLDDIDIAPGKLILDAGCGNGRYTNQAAQLGAQVIGIDLGYGVKSAFKHLKNNANVHIIQGDLFDLPFKQQIFDTIFSNGVLMHTGDAHKAFTSIAQFVKNSGVLVAHLYHKRNIIFEIIDKIIRFFTTKMSIKKNIKFAKFMSGWGKNLMAKGTWAHWFRYIEVLPTVHHMYDWYSAQIATHHTYPEVEDWYKNEGFRIIRTNEPPKGCITFLDKPESLTIKGIKI